MIEKIKAFAQSMKDAILYVLAPVGIVIAYILHLRHKITDLEAITGGSKAESELAEAVGKLSEEERQANEDEANYRRDRNSLNE